MSKLSLFYQFMTGPVSLSRRFASVGLGVLLAFLLAGCIHVTDSHGQSTVEPSTLVPFEELFVLADTVVLDPSVLLGQIWFIDADMSGHMLITDYSSGFVHLFESTGDHVSTFDKDVCHPTDFPHSMYAARFADNGNILVTTWEGKMVVFDRSGNCLAARLDLTSSLSFCTRGDSLFTYLGLQGPEQKTVIEVYSMDLEFQQAIELAPPEFPRLNSSDLGYHGRNMDCFGDGPLYKHHEDMDATPVSGQGPWTQFRPEFFIKRDKDVPRTQDPRDRIKAKNAFPLLYGLYALDENVRMSLFSGISETYSPEGFTGRSVSGLSIVSNNGQFEAVSTVPPKAPYTARHGHLYFVGPIVPTPDGDAGNSSIIRYRFIPPGDA